MLYMFERRCREEYAACRSYMFERPLSALRVAMRACELMICAAAMAVFARYVDAA